MGLLFQWFPRIVLLFIGVVLAKVGLTLGLNPSGITDVQAQGAGVTHLRVAFGGFHLGLGLLCLAAGIFRDITRTGLIAAAIILGSVVAFRILGLFVDGRTPSNLSTLRNEVPPFFLAIVALGLNLLASRA